MDNSKRTSAWKRNEALEALLADLAELLGPAESRVNERDRNAPELPVVLVVGPPRSGTTLVMQLIAATGLCAYPSNLLSRFYYAPAIGARIQRLLLDPEVSFRGEFDDLRPDVPEFRSQLGKTAGTLAPNEFWYFWRRFLPTREIEWMGERFGDADVAGLRAELRSITRAFGAPFACKGMMVQYDLAPFAEAVPNAIFVHIERDPGTNAASLLDARRSFFGDAEQWYSAKPREFPELERLTPEEQVRGQVEATNRAIADDGADVGASRYLHVGYESLCDDPARLFAGLRERIVAMSPQLADRLPPTYDGPDRFAVTRP